MTELAVGATMLPPDTYTPVARLGVSMVMSMMTWGSSAGAKHRNETTTSPDWPLSAVPVLPPMR